MADEREREKGGGVLASSRYMNYGARDGGCCLNYIIVNWSRRPIPSSS